MNKNNDFSEDVPQKNFSWTTVNIIIAVLCIVNSCFLAIWLCAALGITTPMIAIDILLNIFLAIFYRKWRKIKDFQWQKGRKLKTAVIILRICVIIAIVLTFLVPYIVVSPDLNYSKQMYQVKKFICCYGIHSSDMLKYFPEKLPEMCEDYKFITQSGASIAQDYHPSAYLIFHTDTTTMHELEEDYKQLDGAELVEINIEAIYSHIDKQKNVIDVPKAFPGHVFGRLDDEHIDDFFDAVFYKVPSYYDRGCIFDYSSGLVVYYWT